MLWLKAFHVVSVVSWFAALLYLPRLFVYHSQIQGAGIDDPAGNARFKVMERKLFGLMTFAAVLALGFGVAMLAVAPDYLLMRCCSSSPPTGIRIRSAGIACSTKSRHCCWWASSSWSWSSRSDPSG